MRRLLILFLAASSLAAAEPGPQAKPEYPLYSPFFGSSHKFTDEDLARLAGAFDFVYGQSPAKEEMDRARKINSGVKFIRYIGAWTVNAETAERKLRREILHHQVATLAQDIDATVAVFRLDEIPEYRPLVLKASNVSGPYSRSAREYVTWVRIGDDMMRVEAFDAKTREIRVARAFDGAKAQRHARGARVFCPDYGMPPGEVNEPHISKALSYHYDPAAPARWNLILETLVRFVEQGGDGIWIDILMDRSLRERDMQGREWKAPAWNFAENRSYTKDEFRRKNEEGVRYVQEEFRRRFGRYPVIYGNNMMASRFEEGQAGHKFYLLPTAAKPRPLDGMCIEDFMGGYDQEEWDLWSRDRTVTVPKKACYPCDAGYKNWAENVKMLMQCSQSGMAAIPLIINAGMKTAIFEAIDRERRHEWELWAYASYLLGVERKNGQCPTKLGVPMFRREGDRRFVDLAPMYYWKIGEPAESVKPADLDRYRIEGTQVYRRRFTNGLVLVNPGGRRENVALEATYTDPDLKAPVKAVVLAPQSGKILLRAR